MIYLGMLVHFFHQNFMFQQVMKHSNIPLDFLQQVVVITFYSGQATLIRQLLGDVTWSWIYGGMPCALGECPALKN